MAHHCDVGGIAPGSTAMHATEIFQEGLRLPIVKLYERGEPNTTAFRIIERNTRQPVQMLGDLKAQVAACAAGERGYLEILDRYGADTVPVYLEALQTRAETLMRGEIAALPDGEYSYTDYIDGFGENPQPIRIAVKLIIRGDELTVDLTGTSEQVQAAINCPVAMSASCAWCAIRCIGAPDIPNCDGYMRPIKVIAPSGTIVNPVLPAACAARGVIGYRVFDTIMGALAQIVPRPRDRRLRGRADAVRDRRLAEWNAVRAHRSDGRHLGRARRARTGRRAFPIPRPIFPTSRSRSSRRSCRCR